MTRGGATERGTTTVGEAFSPRWKIAVTALAIPNATLPPPAPNCTLWSRPLSSTPRRDWHAWSRAHASQVVPVEWLADSDEPTPTMKLKRRASSNRSTQRRSTRSTPIRRPDETRELQPRRLRRGYRRQLVALADLGGVPTDIAALLAVGPDVAEQVNRQAA